MHHVDLIREYDRHAREATSPSERRRFTETRDLLEDFRAVFAAEDFPDDRVRLCLVIDRPTASRPPRAQ